MYIHIHIYLQLSSFWFCLNLPPQSLAQSQSLPSFQFPMCKYNGICSGSWHGADVSCYSLCSSACLTGQVSRDTAGHSFLNLTKPVNSMDLTSSSSSAVTATSVACCRLSEASLLCDLPNLCLNTVFEFFLGMGRAL